MNHIINDVKDYNCVGFILNRNRKTGRLLWKEEIRLTIIWIWQMSYLKDAPVFGGTLGLSL